MKTHPSLLTRLGHERGATIVLVAVGMVMLLGFAALAIDVGYVLVVRNELQNAADAAALAGAASLYPANPDPDWSEAASIATDAIRDNSAANVALTGGDVQPGYWNLRGTPSGLQPVTITPGDCDAAAVMVTVNKSTGNNGGPLGLFFAPMLGINAMPVAASAVAVVSHPGSVGQGQVLLPMALTEYAYSDLFWDSANNRPRTLFGNPIEFPLGGLLGQLWGQWTSFETATVWLGDLHENPTPLTIDDDIWIVPFPLSRPDVSHMIGATVLLPVVSHPAWGGWMQIEGFGAFVITGVGPLGNPLGHLTTNYRVGVGSGCGPNYGAFTPPNLAK